MARSLTVPYTASLPMSPPGKNMGLTTNVSVVNARRSAPQFDHRGYRAPALDSRQQSSRGLNAGRNIESINCRMKRPPPPWAICTVG